MSIFGIQEKLRKQQLDICLHALEEAVDNFLSRHEVIEALSQNGEIIEDDPASFCCLACCKSKQ